MRATIIVLSYNGALYIEQCLASLLPLPENFQLLVVDNGSADSSTAIARRFEPEAIVVENRSNAGFSGGMNHGMRLALGIERQESAELQPADVVVLLNQDTRCLSGWHEAMLAPFADPLVGAVGCKIYGADERTLLHVGGTISEPRALCYHMGNGEVDEGQFDDVRAVEYATGAALALRGTVLAQIGLLDERYNPAYMEEVDLCVRIRQAGYSIVVNPAAQVVHHEGGHTDQQRRNYWLTRGRLLFLIKHRPLDELLEAFAPAEHADLQLSAGHDDMRAIKRAYLDAILRLPDWCAARAEQRGSPVSAAEQGQLLDLLSRLRERCTYVDAAALVRQTIEG